MLTTKSSNFSLMTVLVVLLLFVAGCGEKRDVKADRHKVMKLALAVYDFHDVRKKFPFAEEVVGFPTKFNSSLCKWRLRVCYSVKEEIFFQFRYDEKWDSETNLEMLKDGEQLFVLSNGSLMSAVKRPVPIERVADLLQDGKENTIMLIENPNLTSSEWTQDNDLSIDEAIALIREIRRGNTLFVAMFDGTALQIPYLDPQEFSDEDIRNLFDHRDGKSVEKIMKKFIKNKNF